MERKIILSDQKKEKYHQLFIHNSTIDGLIVLVSLRPTEEDSPDAASAAMGVILL